MSSSRITQPSARGMIGFRVLWRYPHWKGHSWLLHRMSTLSTNTFSQANRAHGHLASNTPIGWPGRVWDYVYEKFPRIEMSFVGSWLYMNRQPTLRSATISKVHQTPLCGDGFPHNRSSVIPFAFHESSTTISSIFTMILWYFFCVLCVTAAEQRFQFRDDDYVQYRTVSLR